MCAACSQLGAGARGGGPATLFPREHFHGRREAASALLGFDALRGEGSAWQVQSRQSHLLPSPCQPETFRQCWSSLRGVKDNYSQHLPPRSHPVYNLQYIMLHFYYYTSSQAPGWQDSQQAEQGAFCMENSQQEERFLGSLWIYVWV